MRLKAGILLIVLGILGLTVGSVVLKRQPEASPNIKAINLFWSGGYEVAYDALDAFNAVLKDHPDNAEALAYRGAINESWLYDDEAAAADYEQARTLDPVSGLVDGLQAYNDIGSGEAAAIETKAQIAISAGNPIGLLVLGDLASSNKEYDAAIEHYTQAITTENKQFISFTARLYASRAEALRRLSRFDEALADVTQALALVPDHERALLVQNSIAWSTGDVEAALVTGINRFWTQDYETDSSFDVFDAILQTHPDNAQALAYRGAIQATWYYNYEAAEVDYKRSLEIDATSGLVEGLQAYVALTEDGEDFEANVQAAIQAGNPIGSLVLAQNAEYNSDSETAISHYTQAIADDSGLYTDFTARLYAGRAEALRLLARYDDAQIDVAKALELDPDNYQALNTQDIMTWSTRPAEEVLIEGITLFWSDEDGDHYKAYQVFDAILQTHPDNADAFAYRASFGYDYDKSIDELFKEALALGSTPGLVEGLQAYNAIENDEDDTAKEKAQVSADLGNPIGSFMLGRVAYRADEYEDAMGFYDQALSADSKLYLTFTAEVHIARARVFRQLDRYDESIPDLSLAIELVPTDYHTVALRGDSYRMMSQYPRAIKDFNAALAVDPDYMYALGERADTYYFLDKYELALADVTRVLDDDPDDTFSLNTRGSIYKQLGNFEASVADYTRILEIDPEDAFAYGNRALLYLDMESASKALVDINQALAILPDDLYLLSVRGATYRQLREYQKALADYNRVLEMAPNDSYALDGRGRVYYSMGELDNALADFNRVLERNSEHVSVLLSRARAYDKMGKRAEAIADVKAALALEPDNKDAQELLDDVMNPLS